MASPSKILTTEAALNVTGKKELFILTFRYAGTCINSPGLKRELNEIGWLKVTHLTNVYRRYIVAEERGKFSLDTKQIWKILDKHTNKSEDGEVKYGIAKVVTENELLSKYEGLSDLFEETGED